MPSSVDRCVVLVEGESDRCALTTLARRQSPDLSGDGVDVDVDVDVVAMSGITNLRKHLVRYDGARLLVLHDGAEGAYVARVLSRTESAVESFACEQDLEDELIRALGVEAVLAVLDRAGDLASFRILQRQPAQRERPVVQQLRRFIGAHSGHKLRYAGLLAEALDLDAVPKPLDGVLAAARLRA